MNLRVLRSASVLLLTTVASVTASAAPTDWKLVWADEFTTPGRPDPARWTYESGFVRNQEKQLYTDRPENACVENGMLVIEARKERCANPRFDAAALAKVAGTPAAGKITDRTTREAEYTSASVITRGKAAWKYGRVEVRAKLPGGRGMWPAIWMLGSNIGTVGWPRCGEIDIMEFVGFEPDNIHANVHTWDRVRGQMSQAQAEQRGLRSIRKVPHPFDDFHVYALEWDAERMRIFVDDTAYLTYVNPHTGENAWPFDQPFYLLLNIAVGGQWGGQHGIDDAIFPQRLLIDYVRVYERSGSP